MAVLSAVLLFAGFLLYGGRAVGLGKLPDTWNWQKEEGQVYVSLPFAHHRQRTIRLWRNEEENKYYLFLPSFWQEGDSLRLWTQEKSALRINGVPVPDSGKVDFLEKGVCTLEIDGVNFPMEVMAASGLPAMFVDMETEKKDALYELPYTQQYGAEVSLIETDGQVGAEGLVERFRVRGNTSADWVKKPYQLTMQQATGFLGMKSAVKWNLLSNWSDKTLLRNKLVFDMAAEAGMSWSPDSRFVDLYINGEYQGCYQLSEKVEIGAGRLDIHNLEDYTLYEPTAEELDLEKMAQISKEDPGQAGIKELENGIRFRGYKTQIGTENITGGYLLEIERPSRIYESASFFITGRGQPVTVKQPKYADETEVSYIAGCWQTFEDALYAEDGINPGTGLHYTEYIDQESFARKYLVEEIARNYDASSTSQYFYKDEDSIDSRIFAGPVWDYDMSLGNPIMSPRTNQHYISSVSPYGLFAALPMDDFSIWYRMYEKEDFQKLVGSLYEADFLPYLKRLESGKIDELAQEIEESALMDGIRWNRNGGGDTASRKREYRESVRQLEEFIAVREYYLTGLWIEGRESKKVYLDGGDADMYISYVEGLVGDVLEEPLPPEKEGYTFIRWLNGYTKEPYDFTKAYDGGDLYFVAEYRNDADGSILISGE